MAQEQQKPVDDGASDISTFATGASIVFLGKLFRSFAQFILLIVISRILGVESFGLYILGFTVISFLEVVARMGLDNAAIRYVSMHTGVGEGEIVMAVITRTMLYAFLFSLLITTGLYFGSGLLAIQVFDKPELVPVFQIMSVSIPFLTLMAIALAVTQGFKRMQYTAYCRDIFFPLSNLALVLVAYLFGGRLIGFTLAWVSAAAMSFLISLHYLRRVVAETCYKPAVRTGSSPRLPGLLAYASPLLLIVLLTTLLTWVDTLMLGFFRSSTEVGLYGAATRTAMLTGLILISVNTIFSPMIADLFNRNENQRLEAMFKFSANWIYILCLPCFVIILLFPREIMSFFGTNFSAGWPVLVIVSCAYFLNSSTGSVGNMLIMSGHQKLMMYNSIAIFAFNILANYLLIPRYGMTGAAIASWMSIVSYNVLMLVQVYRYMGMHPYNIKSVKASVYGLIVTLVLALLVLWLPGVSIWRLVLLAPLFLLGYFGLIYKNCFGDEERILLDKIAAKLAPTSHAASGE